ncbi:membrane protein [Sphaerisporangium krabiense]|uniref:Flp pilus assembly protein TadB n=1 Tax=Sphaerisporangium krabiense TaxID=763782 RepID=A0A7W8ZBF8_9ACTN|nr:phage holin family protein [Sphaerisporangium krabiense]MBB5630836.1 Flp pilus assembly protein TadB [Sphaerisporangium krabiense]GII65481.1 membrane protein [Sphaerisporangium krabiense]
MTDLMRETRAETNPYASLSTAELIKHLSEDVSRLVRDEIRLATMELSRKGKRAGLGAGLFGGAGVMALYGGGALVATVILALALVLPAWLAALIVGVALLIVAALMALVGKEQVSRATPPLPEEAIRSMKADVDVLKESAHR